MTAPRPEGLYVRPECPEPSRWLAPDGIATEVDVSALLGALVRAVKPDLAVETGTYLGDSAEAIGRALLAEGRGRLITIEAGRERALMAAERLKGLPVDVAFANSVEWTPPGRIDLLFVDSEYDARVEEVRRFKQWASPRCVVVAHDTVVDEYLAKLERLASEGVVRSWTILPTPRGLAIGRYR